METNSIGHENKYHLQVTFEDKTDPKTQKRAKQFSSKSLIASAFLSSFLPLKSKTKIIW